MSAAGGLGGALLHSRANSPALSIVFGVLLLFAGLSGLAGWAQRMRFGRKSAWIAGALSGLFGGLRRRRGMPKYNPGHWQVFRQLALPTNPVTLTTNPAFRVPLAHRLA